MTNYREFHKKFGGLTDAQIDCSKHDWENTEETGWHIVTPNEEILQRVKVCTKCKLGIYHGEELGKRLHFKPVTVLKPEDVDSFNKRDQ